MKKTLTLILVVCIVASLACCGKAGSTPDDTSASSGNNSESSSNVPSEGNNMYSNNVIICFGDSITEGMAMNKGYRYPDILAKQMGNQYKVINAGVGGEKCHAIMSRANAIEFTLTNDIFFNKGQSEVVLDRKLFTAADGNEIIYRYTFFGNELKLSNLTIDGVPYTMRVESGADEDSHKYIITRSETSSDLSIKKGAKVQYDYSEYYDNIHCVIVLMGANGGYTDINDLIGHYKKMEAMADNFIALVPHYGTDYSAEFKAAFGDRCVDIRNYMKSGAIWTDFPEYKKSEFADYLLSKDIIPTEFTYKNQKSDPHFNAAGYKVLGTLVYKKGVELGYWN